MTIKGGFVPTLNDAGELFPHMMGTTYTIFLLQKALRYFTTYWQVGRGEPHGRTLTPALESVMLSLKSSNT